MVIINIFPVLLIILLYVLSAIPLFDNAIIGLLMGVGIVNMAFTSLSSKRILLYYIFPPVIVMLCAYRGYDSFRDFVSEFKIFSLLYLPYAVDLIAKYANIKHRHFPIAISVIFAVYFIAGLYGSIFLGVDRMNSLGFSIYVSYSFSILLIGAANELSLKTKLLGLISCFFLGSRTGLVTYLLSWLGNFGTGKPKYFRLLALLPVLILSIFIYSKYYRDQDLRSTQNLDRVNIINGATTFMKRNFTTRDYILGFGPGEQLHGFTTNSDLDYWLNGDFTPRGDFSYILHNEYLRIFFDFGIVGLLIFLAFLFMVYDKWLILPLLLAMTTNSVFFSSTILLSLAYAQHFIHEKQSQGSITL